MKYLAAVLASTLLLPVPQWGNVSLIEMVWTIVGTLALFATLWSLPKVTTDYILAKHATVGPLAEARVLIARGMIRREVIRLAQALIILMIGLYADFQPNPYTKITLVGLVLTGGLVALAVLVAVQSYMDKLQRDAAEHVLKEHDQ